MGSIHDFFRKYYLRGDNYNTFNGPLKDPEINFRMFVDKILNKFKFITTNFLIKSMKKKIVAKISEGLGNQFFMYANSYAISRKFNFDFFIDPYSGYYKKNIRHFMLDNFNISSKVASPNWIFSNNFSNFYKKILVNLEYFQKYKSFIFEKKRLKIKLTQYNQLDLKIYE
jgi:hypothetical protein